MTPWILYNDGNLGNSVLNSPGTDLTEVKVIRFKEIIVDELIGCSNPAWLKLVILMKKQNTFYKWKKFLMICLENHFSDLFGLTLILIKMLRANRTVNAFYYKVSLALISVFKLVSNLYL